ncbi:guanine nucleotide-binding protein-like 3 homolog [Ornithodoros turicata]|uniref:guanine nucleotide-binding protein-like 3 homolog n=1 Tax=Ornithodoros turicata TaxID=34597 RepID=UPI00313A0E0E
MPNINKKQSKRVSCRQRYKVQKKVRQHLKKKRREAKKEAKKNPNKFKPKDPGVPNSLPFKAEVLKEAQACKKRQEEMRAEMKKRQKEERLGKFMQNRDLQTVREDAEQRSEEFEGVKLLKEHLKQTGQLDKFKGELQCRSFYQEFRKVVEGADVILQVLDARDPLGTRSPQLEQLVLSKGKRLVLVLNKVDLIPRENLQKWLKYLRNEFPAIGFKASTQLQKNNLSRSWVADVTKASEVMQQSSRCLGANTLMKILGNYCRNRDIKTCITVGVVGFPNVGKSSIVNSLKRMRSCTVGARPGVTQVMQKVEIDKRVMLLDSPGVVLARESSEATVALRNVKKVESIEDPIAPATSILRRSSKDQFRIHYKLPDFSTVEECLSLMAKRMGLLKKGGVPNTFQAARRILSDWNTGRIKYYTHPPETHELPTHLGAEIVSTMSAEFDIDSLETAEQEEFKSVRVVRPCDAVAMDTMGIVEEISEKGDTEGDMEMDADNEKMTVDLSESRKDKKRKARSATNPPVERDPMAPLQANRERRLAFKKMLRKRKKNEKLATSLSTTLETALAAFGGAGDQGIAKMEA